MSLAPEDRKLLIDINREVGEVKTAVQDLTTTVSKHVADDAVVHERLHARISPLQAEGKASNLKHRIAIGLGLAGTAGAGAGATEPGWLSAILRLFSDG